MKPTAKPNLLMVADTYYPKVDGILRFMKEFSDRQDTFSVSLLVPFLGERTGRRARYVLPSGVLSLSGYPSMKLSCSNFRRIKEAVRESDIVFAQGPALASILAIYYGRRYKKKTIAYVHVLSWTLFGKFMPPLFQRLAVTLLRRFFVRVYNKCDAIIVPYPGLREYLRQEGVHTDIVVARLGVDIDRFVPPADKRKSKEKVGIAGNKTVIGYVGRISREKNVQALLAAFRKLPRQRELVLLIVGDGPQEQKKPFLETKNCLVTGFVSKVEEYLKAMDLFVMPSHTETTSLATLEAMATGLPVITTRIGFMKSYITKDYNGTFFPRNNPRVLAEKLEHLIENKTRRAGLGRNARKTMAYSFSWERSINRIVRILFREWKRR